MHCFRFGTIAAVAVFGFASVASAADLPIKAPVYKAPVAAPGFNWTGFYIGGHVGAQWLRSDNSIYYPAGPLTASVEFTDTSFIGGGQIGYNWQPQGSSWVLGIEADLSGTNHDHSGELFRVVTDHFDGTSKLSTQGSIRGRVGWANNALLLYFAGGVSFGHAELVATTTRDGVGSSSVSSSKTLTGWNVGGGLEYAIDRSWSVGAEYRYTDFGSITIDAPAVVFPAVTGPRTANADFRTSDARLRLNYRFGGP
jgi:outer membrane immunogenic protein